MNDKPKYMPTRECVTHHDACACRQEGFGRALQEVCAERDKYRRALELIRDYVDGGREAGEEIDFHETAIYNTARQALAGGNAT